MRCDPALMDPERIDPSTLLQHAQDWANARKRPFDRALVALALRARPSDVDQMGQCWRTGSAEHLMRHVERSQAVDVTAVSAMVDGLDTFWRFLRATGRMRSGSAEPKELTREARRAARRMTLSAPTAEASLTAVDEPLTAELLRGTLDGLRRRTQEGDATDIARHLEHWGPEHFSDDDVHHDDDDWGDEDGWGDEDDWEDDLARQDDLMEQTWELLPGREFDWMEDHLLAVPTQDVQESRLIRDCLRLARWVGSGRRVTSDGRLGPADLQEAHGALQPQGSGEPEGLHALWEACVAADLITVESTVARATPSAQPDPPAGTEWAELAQTAIIAALLVRLRELPFEPLLRVLFPFLREGVDRVEVTEVRDWWWSHRANIWSALGTQAPAVRQLSDREVDRVLTHAEDTGIWRREGTVLHQTPLGRCVAAQLMLDFEERRVPLSV